MITAQERFDKLLWQTAFETVYSDYVPLPEDCKDYQEFFEKVSTWYEEAPEREHIRCPLVLTEDGDTPWMCETYPDFWNDYEALRDTFDTECTSLKFFIERNWQLLVEVFGNTQT